MVADALPVPAFEARGHVERENRVGRTAVGDYYFTVVRR